MDPTLVPTFRSTLASGRPRQLMQAEPPLAHPATARRSPERSIPWPEELLEAFSLRMARHGMSVSRALMQRDKGYALQQLVHGQDLGDEALRLMAAQLFRHFEAQQSGVGPLH